MHRTKIRSYSALLVLLLAAMPASLIAHKKSLPRVIWRDPGDMAILNLLAGAAEGHGPLPDSTFTFVKEDAGGTSAKFDVKDQHGVTWKVKLGEEAQSETAATRLLWAAGYFVDEDSYVAKLTVKDLPALHRGDEFVSPGGVVRGARLERKVKGSKKLGTWDWFRNPFLDTQELNGLRVMMSLMNNWDLKTINNSIDEFGGERRYLVSDVGATFGNTGNSLTRSKSNPEAYAESTFIARTTPDVIDFVLHSRPFLLSAINLPNYRTRTRIEQITRQVPRADAKWLGRRLSMLSEEQIRDCFRAAGYAPEDIEVYTRVVRKRIAELNAL